MISAGSFWLWCSKAASRFLQSLAQAVQECFWGYEEANELYVFKICGVAIDKKILLEV